jgi:hypothetical protein
MSQSPCIHYFPFYQSRPCRGLYEDTLDFIHYIFVMDGLRRWSLPSAPKRWRSDCYGTLFGRGRRRAFGEKTGPASTLGDSALVARASGVGGTLKVQSL